MAKMCGVLAPSSLALAPPLASFRNVESVSLDLFATVVVLTAILINEHCRT